MNELQAFIESHGIRFFSAREVTLQRRWSRHELPDRGDWENVIPALHLADAIRAALGAPIRVVSGYRTADYNRAVGGSPFSEHMYFRAVDIQPVDAARFEEMITLAHCAVDVARSLGLNVALLIYDRFIHIDTGSTRRTNLTRDFRER